MILHVALLMQTALANNALTFPAVRLSTQLYRLWNPKTGDPIGIVSYAFADEAMRLPANRKTVELVFRGDRKHPATHPDSAIVERLAFSPMSTHVNGYAIIPLTLSAQSWSVDMRRIGSSDSLARQENFEPLGQRALMLSDLVLGTEGQHVITLVGEDSVALAPQLVVDRMESVAIYYQLRSDTRRSSVLTTVRVIRMLGQVEQGDEGLSIGFRGDVRSGFNLIRRNLDVSQLAGGRYVVDVTVSDSARRITATRRGMLDLRR